jgi:hypothetical protein
MKKQEYVNVPPHQLHFVLGSRQFCWMLTFLHLRLRLSMVQSAFCDFLEWKSAAVMIEFMEFNGFNNTFVVLLIASLLSELLFVSLLTKASAKIKGLFIIVGAIFSSYASFKLKL